MVFIFGLIHGFGLSTRLQQLNLMEHDLIYSILSFNVGVELGQIGALLIVFPFILMIRKESFKRISILLNWGLIILGMLLLIYQLNGYFRFEGHHHNEIHEEEIELDEHNHDTKETPPSHDHNDKNHSHDEHSHSHD